MTEKREEKRNSAPAIGCSLEWRGHVLVTKLHLLLHDHFTCDTGSEVLVKSP